MKFNSGTKKLETSKKILWMTYTIFSITLIIGFICVFKNKDTSLFMYAIPSTGGVFGATVAFYLNKAKMENIFKGKEEFLKYKLDLLKDCTKDVQNDLIEDINHMEESLDNCVDSEMQNVINEKFDVMN